MGVLDSFALAGRTAVVTGAGRGLGRTMAIALSEAGAHVGVIDLDGESATSVAREIGELGGVAVGLRGDVTDRDSIQSFVGKVEAEIGDIDVLVNNAGVVYRPKTPGGSVSIPFEEVEAANWESVISVNLKGVFNCCQIIGSRMLSRGSGSIINIASISSMIANIGRSNNAYCASKGGVLMLTRQLAVEWAPKGIRVNAISPGYMKSALGAPLDDPKIKDLLHTMTPLGRPGFPDDLKGVVVFLASDASAYVVGQAIVVDGGYSAV